MFTPSELKNLCEQYHLSPSKAYGQHFLISVAPIKKMIEAAGLTSDDTVIEIGPGFGVLTLAIAPLVKKVIALEIEQKLKPYWEEAQKQYTNVEIVWGNALDQLSPIAYRLSQSYKLLANLPYHITSDALRMLLEQNHKPERIVVMVQKEVAERICAKPPLPGVARKAKTGDMSLLAVSVQYYGESSIITTVPAGAFWPPPKVDSAVICIETKEQKNERTEEHIDDRQFFAVVRAGFSHKRKQLWHNLAAGLHLSPAMVKGILKDICGNEKVRAEELSVGEWKRIVIMVHHK